MRKLEQQCTRNGQIFPSPRPGEVIWETIPVFCWLKEPNIETYRVEVRHADGRAAWQGETNVNYIVPSVSLFVGDYEWNLYGADAERGWQAFSIAEDAVTLPRPTAADVLAKVPDVRPRHLFQKEDIPVLLAQLANAVETLRRNIALALTRPMPKPPRFHRDPEALPYREYFGQHRDHCDRDLVACALGHALLNDQLAASHAKELLLTICDWNTEGPCSLEGPWGDEIGLSHARCLPAVFDLCFDLLNEKEQLFVGRTVAAYAMQCERRLSKLDFCQNPGDSHAGRLPAYLGEAALALHGLDIVPEAVLERWLTYALDIYGGIFPYFGGPDGGWAEGMFYASSYTKWFLPFFSALNRFAGLDFLKRPFYQRYPRYLQHFCPPGWEIHPFGDGYWCAPDDAEWPGFFAQNPYHIYAEQFGTPLLKQWSKDAQKQEIFKLHLLDVFLPVQESDAPSLAGDTTRACLFPDAGLLSLHTNPEHPENDLALVARASRYGSISHQHADQGSFALMCGGTALLSPSGYFGRQYGTLHHREWTNQSIAHNTLLIDGMGQASFSYQATGEVLFARDEGDRLVGAVDPSAAYPQVESWIRTFELTEHELIVHDKLLLDQPYEVTWLLHALSRPEQTEEGMHLNRNGKHLAIIPERGDLASPSISDAFGVDLNAGEPEAYHVQMPPQYHMSWKTPVRKEHDIRVRFVIG